MKRTIFLKSFEKSVVVDGTDYVVRQDAHAQTLSIVRKEDNTPIYTYGNNDYLLKYRKTHLETIKEVFERLGIDRYVIAMK